MALAGPLFEASSCPRPSPQPRMLRCHCTFYETLSIRSLAQFLPMRGSLASAGVLGVDPGHTATPLPHPPTHTARYAKWSFELTRRLRAALGPLAVLVGNSAGELNDGALNGITLEMESCVSRNCTAAVLDQRNASGTLAPVGVFWLTHAESMPPLEQCRRVREMQQTLPWMRAGTDFIDLSHIVCNASLLPALPPLLPPPPA